VAEINAGYTDIVIAYEKVKQGRRITAVEFKVRERLSVYDNNYYKPIQPKAFNGI
jgi:plasmid replication initiation protein